MLGIGVVFTGQGVGLVKGSFMTGRPLWAVIGVVMVAGALALLYAAGRRGPRT
jgi:hypothetical protein